MAPTYRIICCALLLAFALSIEQNEDHEMALLACTHSAHAFILDHMDSLELKSTLEGTSVQSLIKTHFNNYLSNCTSNTSPKDAWNYFSLGTPLMDLYELEEVIMKGENKEKLLEKAHARIVETAKKEYIRLSTHSSYGKVSLSIYLIIGIIVAISVMLTYCIPINKGIYGPVRRY